MKNTIVLICLIAGCTYAAFGANPSTDFVLGTEIGSTAGVIVHDTAGNGVTYPTNNTQWAGLSPIGSTGDPVWLGQDDSGSPADTYRVVAVSARSNIAGNYTIKATVPPLAADGSGRMGYTVTINGTPTAVAKSDTSKTIELATFSVSTGLVYKTQEFRIDLNANDYASAVTGSYRSTWTIELIAGQ